MEPAETPPHAPPVKALSRRKSALYTLVVILLLFGLPEAVLRLIDAIPHPADGTGAGTGDTRLEGNPYLLWEMSPGIRREQGTVVHVNRLGMRGPEITRPKPAGVRRFITLGDSSVYGFGVEDGEVFSSVAAGLLGPAVEAINGAVPGYSTWQSINLLEMRGLSTEPDLVVIASIWSDNHYDAFVDRELLLAYRDHEQGWAGRTRRLLGHSALFRYVARKVGAGQEAERVRRVGWMQSGQPAPGQGETRRRRVAVNDYTRNLETLVRIAGEHGAEVMFVLLANADDVEGRAPREGAWVIYRQAMRDTAKRHGSPVLEVPDLFIRTGLTRRDLFIDQLHPTARGHRLMGEALAGMLREARWPEGGKVMREGPGGGVPRYVDPGEVIVQTTPHAPALLPGGMARVQPGFSRPERVVQSGPAVAVRGTLKCDRCQSGSVQIDVLEAGVRVANPRRLSHHRLARPGPFQLEIRGAKAIRFRIIVDLTGNGPDPGDDSIDLHAGSIDVSRGAVEDLVIDVDKRALVSSRLVVE